MTFFNKFMPRFIIFVIIIVFLLALFYSIDRRVDGLGIFSIVCAILFFSYMLSKIGKRHVNGESFEDSTSNAFSHLKIITNPLFIRVLPSLLTVMFSFLERHKEKLDKAAAHELQQELQQTLNKFNSGFEDLESHLKEKSNLTPKAK